MKSKKNILVTGGAGFIGAHVSDALIRLGYHVIALDDLSGGYKDNVPNKAFFVKGSILDVALLKKLFNQYRFDYVFHLAAYAAEGLSHFIKNFNYNNNVIGSINLINASINHDVKCFVFTSSIAVYGANQLPMQETMTPHPEDSYGIAKWAVELELEASHKMFGLNYIIFRPHNVYGEKQNIADKYRNVIGIFMNNILRKEPLPIFGNGTQTRAFSYISDVAPLMAQSIQNKKCYNQVFNVGADNVYTINELADAVCKAMGQKAHKKYLPARNEVKHAYSDHSKVKKYFGKQAAVSLNDGVSRMTRWVKKAGARQSKHFGNIEILKNLPPSWQHKKS